MDPTILDMQADWQALQADKRVRDAAHDLLAAAFLGRDRLIKEGFASTDPTVTALNAAIARAEGTAP